MTDLEFEGFPLDAIRFLERLKANNSRDWFSAHKKDYEQSLKKPGADFCVAMSHELQTMIGLPVDYKVFRINRDLRFSKDKTPYNTHFRASFFPHSAQNAGPAFHFSLEPDKIVLGAGVMGMNESDLDGYRSKIDGVEGHALKVILDALEKDGFGLSEPELKRVPKPFDPEHTHGPLLRRKSLTAWFQYDEVELACAADCVSVFCRKYSSLKPLLDWMGA